MQEVTSPALPNPRQTTDAVTGQSAASLSWCPFCRCRSESRAGSSVRELTGVLHGILYRTPRLYGFVLETDNFLHRIAILCRQPYAAFVLVMTSVCRSEDQPRPEMYIRKYACIRDIESFVKAHPWATMIDLETYMDAWQAGAAWAESNSCSADQHKIVSRSC